MSTSPKIAVVLAGCGRADGSEVFETVTALLAIAKNGGSYQCFAPNIEQSAVVNILTGEKTNERRSVLIEAGRICRGDIKDLKEFNVKDFDAVIFPGGLGAVTNWCDYAAEGVNCTVNQDISNTMLKCYDNKLPIGAMCIAPVVVAKVLGGYGIKITIGSDEQTARAVEAMGAVNEVCQATEIAVDEKHKIVTTPAYMMAHSITEVAEGADKIVKAIMKML